MYFETQFVAMPDDINWIQVRMSSWFFRCNMKLNPDDKYLFIFCFLRLGLGEIVSPIAECSYCNLQWRLKINLIVLNVFWNSPRSARFIGLCCNRRLRTKSRFLLVSTDIESRCQLVRPLGFTSLWKMLTICIKAASLFYFCVSF